MKKYIRAVFSATIVVSALFLCFEKATAQTIIYVDQYATGNNDGTTWAHAFTGLQPALSAAAEGDQIWVAAGIYLPGDTLTATFLLDKNIRLYGGFAGNEATLDARNPALNLTILSGDLNGDDLGGDLDSNRTDNVRTVLLIENNITNETIIDGFTLRGGHAAGGNSAFYERRGGGVFSSGAPMISHCVFTDNVADAEGGGLCFHGTNAGGAFVSNCLFSNNRAKDGGAMMVFYTDTGAIQIENCEFVQNKATEQGGAVQIFNSNCQVTGTLFSQNTAGRNGGAIDSQTNTDNLLTALEGNVFLDNQSLSGGAVRWQTNSGLGSHNNRLTAVDCTFSHNSAVEPDTSGQGMRRGGAIQLTIDRTTNGGMVQLAACVFVDNNSTHEGSAVYAALEGLDMDFEVRGCNFLENKAGEAGGLYLETRDIATGEVLLDSSLFFLNQAQRGAGLFLAGEGTAGMQFQVRNTTFADNLSDETGAGLYVFCTDSAAMELQLSHCRFGGNKAQQTAGAFHLAAGNPNLKATLSACLFDQNQSPHGAAITAGLLGSQAVTGSSLVLDNCLLTRHTGAAAVVANDSFPEIRFVNCTVADNLVGALMTSSEGSLTLQNTILFNPPFQELQLLAGDAPVVSLGGNVAGDLSLATFFNGTDQNDTDPLFEGAGSLPYSLTEDSPAVDGGILPDEVPAFDYAGHERVQGCIDAGAFESPFIQNTACLSGWQEQMPAVGRMMLYPNPAENVLTLFPENGWNGEVSLRMLNMLGQEVRFFVFSKNAPSESVQVDVSHLKSGVYSVLLSNGKQASGGIFVKK